MKINNSKLIAVVLFYLTVTNVQAQNWQIYSPANKHFSVEFPYSPKVSCDKGNCEYESVALGGDGYSYSIYEANFIDWEKSLGRKFSRDKIIFYLAVLSIGHDNDAGNMSEMPIVSNGITGKEYSYGYKRGRAFVNGDKFYFIVFKGESKNRNSSLFDKESREQLFSADAEHFLDSFRINRSNNKRKK